MPQDNPKTQRLGMGRPTVTKKVESKDAKDNGWIQQVQLQTSKTYNTNSETARSQANWEFSKEGLKSPAKKRNEEDPRTSTKETTQPEACKKRESTGLTNQKGAPKKEPCRPEMEGSDQTKPRRPPVPVEKVFFKHIEGSQGPTLNHQKERRNGAHANKRD